MTNLTLQQTNNSPRISLDSKAHRIIFEGESRPENSQLFYAPILEWLNDYKSLIYFLKDQTRDKIKIKVEFKLEYINSSSAKQIMDIMLLIDKIQSLDGNMIEVEYNWYYDEEDDDMLEGGEEFMDMLGLDNFHLRMC